MKLITKITLITFFTVIHGNISYGQEISKEIWNSIKDGKTENLDELISNENLDKCYEIKGSSYNYLAISVKLKSLESLKYFVKRKANLEGECTGKTPLMYAVKYGQLESVRCLLKNGADLNTTNNGRTALDYAKKYDKSEIEKFLKEYKL